MAADPIGCALLAWEWQRDRAGSPVPLGRGPGWYPGVAPQVP